MSKRLLAFLVMMFLAAPAQAVILIQTVGSSGEAPLDWRTGIEMVYQFEGEMDGDNAVNTGSSGTNCDLTDATTTGDNTRVTGAPEGSLEASFLSGKKGNFTNANATCNNIWQADASFTFGGRFTMLNTDENKRLIDTEYSTAAGFYLYYNTAGRYICYVDSAGGASAAQSTTTPDTSETFVACRYDASANRIEIIVEGTDEDDDTSPGTLDASTRDFDLGNNENYNQDYEGEMDEVFLTSDVLSDIELVRICACGIKGDDCRCDAGTPANYLACSSDSDCEGATCDTSKSTCSGFWTTKCDGASSSIAACNAAVP